jgi:hypothetical protein
MGFDGDISTRVEFSLAVEIAPFLNLIRTGRELQLLAASGKRGTTASSKADLYKTVSTKAEVEEFMSLITDKDDVLHEVLPSRMEVQAWSDADVRDVCSSGGDLELGMRECVICNSDQLNDAIDAILPAGHRIKIEWNRGGNPHDEIDVEYMRVMAVFDDYYEHIARREVRGWHYSDSFTWGIDAIPIASPEEAHSIAKDNGVSFTTTLPSLTNEEEAHVRANIDKLVEAFGLRPRGLVGWKSVSINNGG